MKGRLPKRWDFETEVAVIGAGAAGPTVAISAHAAGAKVLILEKMPKPSGDISISGGCVYAAGTPIQRRLRIKDSPERMYNLYVAACPNANRKEREKMRIIAYGSADAIKWLSKLGVKFPAKKGAPGLTHGGLELLPEYAAAVPPVPGAHACEGGGRVLQETLLSRARDKGIEIVTEMRARELISDTQGRIVGIKAENRGKEVAIRAKRSVVICSGHFAHSKKLIDLYIPEYKTFPTFTADGLEGDGLVMAQEHGAAVANISDCRINIGMPYKGRKALMISRWSPCILVNRGGKRFINDHAGYGPLAKAIIEQEGSMCFVIFDELARKTRQGNILHPYLSLDLSIEIKKGLVKRGSTIENLAREIGVNPTALETTIRKYNENAKLGKDPEFGSVHFVEPIRHPPFYAVRGVPAIGSPTGGLITNLEGQVVDIFGKTIPNLFAVGAVTSTYPGYPGSGSHFANIFVFGRMIGKNAANNPLS